MATPTPELDSRPAAAGRLPVCLVVAMGVEAEPLIQELGLERWPGSAPFALFRGDDAALVVSGVGKVAAAAATAYLYARLGEPSDAVWINVGIAGHRCRAVGESMLAHKVTDAGTKRSWHPPLVFAHSLSTCEVITVEEVERSYDGEGAYDMEAAGFVAAASRLASAELIQVLKVVSDNASSPVEGIDRQRIRTCIADRLPEVKSLREGLLALASEIAAADAGDLDLASFTDRWQFTVGQQRRLRRALQRLRALGADTAALDPRWNELASARDVLKAMEAAVERAS